MRVLHLFSNKRWTGPAEPAANLAAGLREAGVEVTFACSAEGEELPHRMARKARARGLDVRTDLQLLKHFNPLSVARDATALARELRDGRYDLVHCHMSVDHCTAGLARQRTGVNVPIVRSLYDGTEVAGSWANGLALRRCTDALCVASPFVRDDVVARDLVPAGSVHVVDGAVDTQRFAPDLDLPDPRPGWGCAPEHVVFGVVARMQPYRRFDVLFQAFRQAVADAPNARLVLIGRGTREEEVARRPVRQMGLSEAVHFPGYLQGKEYVAAVGALDALIFLMPGSDGTCRAVREALALGVPVIAANRGILPWLVEDQRTGLVVDDSAEMLADTIRRVATDAALRTQLRDGARQRGPERFTLKRQVGSVLQVYEEVRRGR